MILYALLLRFVLVSIDEAHERICTSLDNGFFDACDDLANFIVTNLANFGDDLSYIVSLWNNLVSGLPYDDFLAIELQNQCQQTDLLKSSVRIVENQIRIG